MILSDFLQLNISDAMVRQCDFETYNPYWVAYWKKDNKYMAADYYCESFEDFVLYDSLEEIIRQADECIKGNTVSICDIVERNLIPSVSISINGDFSHWGFDKFYPSVEDALKEHLESGMDFDTGWGGSKKEIESCRIVRIGNILYLAVSAEMDDFPDIFYDVDDSLTEDDIVSLTELSDEYFFMDTSVVNDIQIPFPIIFP